MWNSSVGEVCLFCHICLYQYGVMDIYFILRVKSRIFLFCCSECSRFWTLGILLFGSCCPRTMNILCCCVGGGCVCVLYAFWHWRYPSLILYISCSSLRISRLSKENGSFYWRIVLETKILPQAVLNIPGRPLLLDPLSWCSKWMCLYTNWCIYKYCHCVQFSSVIQSCPTLQLHELLHTRPPCLSPTPRVYPNLCPLSRWCHSTVSSFVVPFSSCPQSFPASGSFQMSQLFASGSQSIGISASTSVLPMNTQDWSPLGWTGWISLQSKGLSRVFSNTAIQRHQFFSPQLFL